MSNWSGYDIVHRARLKLLPSHMNIPEKPIEHLHWTCVEELFHAGLEQPQSEWAAWLITQTTDMELRREVASLLHSWLRSQDLPADTGPELAPSMGALPVERFGPYQAVRLIGRGGMGAVYLAHRADGEFEQSVAIKVIATHLAGDEFVERFRNERQLLASLNHPNITRLLDGAVLPSGDPYLVMEYVEGEPLDQYCDAHKLGVHARLRLFLQVCEAVEYAHRSLIVHRDLKPGNILVTADAVVKLLDFGTATLMAQSSAVTATRNRMVTPRYASPERLRGERANTGNDVFSLGVVLYELLTGAWPYGDPESMISELKRAMGDAVPASPSTALTDAAADNRGVPRDRLQNLLAGDLSAIALKALENDPARRFGSVRQMAEDVERFLEARPVLARAQTAWYRTSKFLRRRWLPISAAAIFVFGLLAATGVAFHQAQLARLQAARAERVSEFAKNTFLSASSTWQSPLRGKSKAIQFIDILDNATERVGKELANDPAAEADLRATMGQTYAMLGDPVKGEKQLRLAIERIGLTPERNSRIASDIHELLCNTLNYEGRYAEAFDECRQSLALARSYGTGLFIGGIMHDTAYMAAKSGVPLKEVESLYREGAELGPSNAATARLWPAVINTRIGQIRVRRGDLAEGDRILRSAERLFRGQPGPPIEIVPTLKALASGARVSGRYDEAVQLLREAVDMLEQRPTAYLGRESVEIELAAVEALSGNRHALERFQKYAQELDVEKTSPIDWSYLEMLAGIVEAHCGLTDSAEPRFRAALSTSRKEALRQPEDRIEIYVNLAQLLSSSGRQKEADALAHEGLQVAAQAYGSFFPEHPLVMRLQRILQPR